MIDTAPTAARTTPGGCAARDHDSECQSTTSQSPFESYARSLDREVHAQAGVVPTAMNPSVTIGAGSPSPDAYHRTITPVG